MKEKNQMIEHGKLILLMGCILVASFLLLLQPFREDTIFQRTEILPETSEIQSLSIGDEAMVQKAKTSLENLLGIALEEDLYNISVEYENVNISGYNTSYSTQTITTAKVSFQNKETKEDDYIITCDTTTGEILALLQDFESPLGESYLDMDALEDKARNIICKISESNPSEIECYDSNIMENTYSGIFYEKDSYEQIIIYLDAFDGTLIYYVKNI